MEGIPKRLMRSPYRIVVHLFCMALLGACAPDCEPTSVEFKINGLVSLNGRPLPGITVARGSVTAVTDNAGKYTIHLSGPPAGRQACVVIRTEPYSGATPSEVCTSFAGGAATATVSLAIGHTPPTIRIDTPGDLGQVPAGESIQPTVTLTTDVTVNGARPTGLFQASLEWRSSADGVLAPWGTIVPIFRLSPGTHALTAHVRDLMGAEAADTVTIQAVLNVANQAPTVTIQTPANGSSFGSGATVGLSGSGSDPEDGPLPGSALAWTSSLDGSLGTGASVSAALSAGTHTVTLTGTDSQAATGADSISVTVAAPASGTGTIQGEVQYGDGLPNVPVVLSGARADTTATNGAGFYQFTELPPGQYTITISPPVWAQIPRQKSTTLGVGEVKVVNFDTSG